LYFRLRPVTALDFSMAIKKLKASVDDSGKEIMKVLSFILLVVIMLMLMFIFMCIVINNTVRHSQVKVCSVIEHCLLICVSCYSLRYTDSEEV
jgi:hypothetical protein